MAIPGYPRGERRYHLFADPQGVVHDLGDDDSYLPNLKAQEQAVGHPLSGEKFDNRDGVEGFEYYEQGTRGPTPAQRAAVSQWLKAHHLD